MAEGVAEITHTAADINITLSISCCLLSLGTINKKLVSDI